MMRVKFASAAAAIAVALTLPAAAEAAAYGCFRANTDLNIRERPYSSADVVGTAAKGDVLEKRKLWCTLRGFWCAVRTKSGVEGYADKSLMDKISCP